MRGALLFLTAAAMGAAAYYGFTRYRDAGDKPSRSGAAVLEAGRQRDLVPAPDDQDAGGAPAAPRAPAPTLAQRPVFYEGDPEAREAPGVPAAVDRPAPQEAAPSPAVLAQPQRAPEPRIELEKRGGALEDDRKLARSTYDEGDKERGAKLLEAVYISLKGQASTDLSPEVERLLEATPAREKKMEYLQYLLKFDKTGRVTDDQLARAVKKTAAAEESTEAALAAWDELTLAYEIAADRVQKTKIMAQVAPFVQKMVFSGRYTPVLKSHHIQAGETLTGIAQLYQTTPDSIRRINNLKSDVIQPRQRVRFLPGKVKIFVDKSDFILWTTVDGRIFLEFPVGLGRGNSTPTGDFRINVRQKDPTWFRPGEPALPPGDPGNILGTRWLGFAETQDHAGFGIHGTSDPGTLGKESSAGCVRMKNEDIEVLYDFVPYGTEVSIRG